MSDNLDDLDPEEDDSKGYKSADDYFPPLYVSGSKAPIPRSVVQDLLDLDYLGVTKDQKISAGFDQDEILQIVLDDDTLNPDRRANGLLHEALVLKITNQVFCEISINRYRILEEKFRRELFDHEDAQNELEEVCLKVAHDEVLNTYRAFISCKKQYNRALDSEANYQTNDPCILEMLRQNSLEAMDRLLDVSNRLFCICLEHLPSDGSKEN